MTFFSSHISRIDVLKVFSSIMLGFFLSSSWIEGTLAAQYFDASSSLLISYPDDYAFVQELSLFDEDFLTSYGIQRSFRLYSGEDLLIDPVLSMHFSDLELYELLETIQFRLLNQEEILNRTALDSTAIEIIGQNYTTQNLQRIFLFEYSGSSIMIMSESADFTIFERFVSSIEKSSSYHDILSHPFETDIRKVIKKGIFRGYPDVKHGPLEFQPDRLINRAEFLKVSVLSSEKVDESVFNSFPFQSFSSIFSDIDDAAWYTPFIYYAFDQKWVQGYTDGTFRPMDEINVAEALKIILRVQGIEIPYNDDVWFLPVFDYAVDQGVLVREGDRYRFTDQVNFFYPYSSISRAQTAAFLSRIVLK